MNGAPYPQPGMNPAGVPRRNPDAVRPKAAPAAFCYDPVRRQHDDVNRVGPGLWVATEVPAFTPISISRGVVPAHGVRKRITIDPKPLHPSMPDYGKDQLRIPVKTDALVARYRAYMKNSNIAEEEPGVTEKIFDEIAIALGERVREVILGTHTVFHNRKHYQLRILKSSPRIMSLLLECEHAVRSNKLIEIERSRTPLTEEETRPIPMGIEMSALCHFLKEEKYQMVSETRSRIARAIESIAPEEARQAREAVQPAIIQNDNAMWGLDYQLRASKNETPSVIHGRDILTYLSMDSHTNPSMFYDVFLEYMIPSERPHPENQPPEKPPG